LLFFYCELLNKSPFEKARDQVCKLYKETYDELTTRYQVFVPTDDDATFDVTVGEDTHWDKFRTSIYTMAVFCFFYALLVLAVIGIENHKVYSDFHKALQVTNSIALIYYALNVFCYRSFWGQSRSCAIFCAIMLAAYFPFHFIISKYIHFGVSWGQSAINVYTLFTCIFGLILILFHLSVDGFTMYKCKKSIKRIKKVFNIWTQIPFDEISFVTKLKLRWMLIKDAVKTLFSLKNIDLENSKKTILESYLKRKVQKELKFLNRKL